MGLWTSNKPHKLTRFFVSNIVYAGQRTNAWQNTCQTPTVLAKGRETSVTPAAVGKNDMVAEPEPSQ